MSSKHPSGQSHSSCEGQGGLAAAVDGSGVMRAAPFPDRPTHFPQRQQQHRVNGVAPSPAQPGCCLQREARLWLRPAPKLSEEYPLRASGL